VADYAEINPMSLNLSYCIRCGSLVLTREVVLHTVWHKSIEDFAELAASQRSTPAPTATVPSVTELCGALDRARGAFEQATPTPDQRQQIEGYAARLYLAEKDLQHVRKHPPNQGELNRLRRIEAALIELGAPDHSELGDPGGLVVAWIKAKLGPYTWRPGDPPPPPMVNVLHDDTDTTANARVYLCRSLVADDIWAWRDDPDHAYAGSGECWEHASREARDPLVHVPGGDL
jgi:hypothetical protein